MSQGDEDELQYLGRAQGYLSSTGDELKLAGVATWVYDTHNGRFEESATLHIDFKKALDEEGRRDERIELGKTRLDALRRALRSYIDVEGGMPRTLSDLYPDYLDDKFLLSTDATERIVLLQVWENYQRFQEKSIEVGRYYSSLPDIYSDADEMLNWERDLTEVWGANFPGGFTLLQLSNTEFDFHLAATIWGSAYEVDGGLPTIYGDTYGPEAIKETMINSCANNMKQLGLSIKMFENENPIDIIPPGFR